MTNNDILRRIRYVFELNDTSMMKMVTLGGGEATRASISAWLKQDDVEGYMSCPDLQLATFLNGFIIFKRGPSEHGIPEPESELNNNLILRKLKIALQFDSDQIIAILELADFRLGKSELSAFFRKPSHKHFRICKDQVLRNFLQGLQFKYRPQTAE
jgi:uncharacterized protein YehS (DUF1456 family)